MNEINLTPFPELRTERLILRQLMPEDVHEVFSLRADPRVSEFITRTPCRSYEEAQEFIQRINNGIAIHEWIYWGIAFQQNNKIIGTICFWNFSKDLYRAEIGYELHPGFQGKGVMQEAFAAVVDYGFNRMKLHSIEANVNPKNVPSIRVLERNNFVREAYFKENYYYNGKFLDTVIYSLLNPQDLK